MQITEQEYGQRYRSRDLSEFVVMHLHAGLININASGDSVHVHVSKSGTVLFEIRV